MVALPYLAVSATHSHRACAQPPTSIDRVAAAARACDSESMESSEPLDAESLLSWVPPSPIPAAQSFLTRDEQEDDEHVPVESDSELVMELDMEVSDLAELRQQQLDVGGSDVREDPRTSPDAVVVEVSASLALRCGRRPAHLHGRVGEARRASGSPRSRAISSGMSSLLCLSPSSAMLLSPQQRQAKLADSSVDWKLLVAHESAIRGLDLPQIQAVHRPIDRKRSARIVLDDMPALQHRPGHHHEPPRSYLSSRAV